MVELSCTSSLFLHFLVGESNTLLFNKQHRFWHRSFQNSIAFIRFSFFSNPQLYALYISIVIFEYLNHPCHRPLIASTFIMQYQNNISNTEILFSTLPFYTWLKWLKILFSRMWQNSLAMCWTQQCHLFQQYKSGLLKFPGGWWHYILWFHCQYVWQSMRQITCRVADGFHS